MDKAVGISDRIKARTAEAARKVGLTPELVVNTIKRNLNFKEVKAKYDDEAGWQYSKRLAVGSVQVAAARLGADLLNLFSDPPSKMILEAGDSLTSVMGKIMDAVRVRNKGLPPPGGAQEDDE